MIRTMLCLALLSPIAWIAIYSIQIISEHQLLLTINIMNGASIKFATNNLSMSFCGLIAFLHPVSLFYTVSYFKHNRLINPLRFYGFFNLTILLGFGLGLSANLFTTFMFYEAITLTTYPLITCNRDNTALISGRYYLSFLMLPSLLFFLPSIIIIHSITGNLDYSINGVFVDTKIADWQINALLAMMVFGITKTAIFPMHTWLLRAMTAPTPVSALLHAVVVVKSGVFTLLLVIYNIFGADMLQQNIWKFCNCNWLFWLASATILYANISAISSNIIKQRLAYSTMGQLSYSILAMSFFSSDGQIASIIQLLSHSFAKITLFFGAGTIYTITRKDRISTTKGVASHMKWTVYLMILASCSIIGLPFTGGFYSKYHILTSSFSINNIVTWIVMIVATLITTSYMTTMLYNFCAQSNITTEGKVTNGAPISMFLAMLSCTLMIFVIPFIFDILMYK